MPSNIVNLFLTDHERDEKMCTQNIWATCTNVTLVDEIDLLGIEETYFYYTPTIFQVLFTLFQFKCGTKKSRPIAARTQPTDAHTRQSHFFTFVGYCQKMIAPCNNRLRVVYIASRTSPPYWTWSVAKWK